MVGWVLLLSVTKSRFCGAFNKIWQGYVVKQWLDRVLLISKRVKALSHLILSPTCTPYRFVVKNILMRGAAVLPLPALPSHLPLNATPWEGSPGNDLPFLFDGSVKGEVKQNKWTKQTCLWGVGREDVFTVLRDGSSRKDWGLEERERLC